MRRVVNTKRKNCPDQCECCGAFKRYNTGGGFICTNVQRCRLAISIEEDLLEVDTERTIKYPAYMQDLVPIMPKWYIDRIIAAVHKHNLLVERNKILNERT